MITEIKTGLFNKTHTRRLPPKLHPDPALGEVAWVLTTSGSIAAAVGNGSIILIGSFVDH
jgi:hypothetical protein